MQRLLYGSDGRLIYRNGRFVTDLNGAPCCCGGGCDPSLLVYAPCGEPCINNPGLLWGYLSTPGGTTFTQPTQGCLRCCDHIYTNPFLRASLRRSGFTDRSVGGDVYFVMGRQEDIIRESAYPFEVFTQTHRVRTECRRSSGCVTTSSLTTQTTNPPTLNTQCTYPLSINTFPTPALQCSPPPPPPVVRYGCFSRGQYDCTNLFVETGLLGDSGSSSTISFDTFRESLDGLLCGGGNACCCGGKCYDRVTAGCGPLYYPGERCGTLAVPCSGREQFSACCVDGTCLDNVSAELCAALNGQHFPQSRCSQVACGDDIGSCCYPDGTCVHTFEQPCRQQGGTWNGPGSSCSTTQCPVIPTGACCTPIGCVGSQTLSQCLAANGTWHQGQPCTPVLCRGVGIIACCLPNQTCLETDCQSCIAQGGICTNERFCSVNPCGLGACCRQTSHGPVCTIETAAQCVGPGATFLGAGTSCTPDPCGSIQTNPFNPIPPREFVRIPVGCSGCGGANVVPI